MGYRYHFPDARSWFGAISGNQVMLNIKSVRDASSIDKERVVLRATSDTDLGRYAVFSCLVFDDDRIRAGHVPDVFWFEDVSLKKDDFVVLYTKAGNNKQKVSEKGYTSFFYYWGKDHALWKAERRAVLVNTADWQSSDEEDEREI